jgi:hypothetical protein
MKTDTAIRKIARIHDKVTDTVVEVIEFVGPNEERKTLELSPSIIVNDRPGFENKLRDAGAALPHDKAKVKEIVDAVAGAIAAEEWTYERQTGWTDRLEAFVLADRGIGNSPSKIIGVKQRHSDVRPSTAGKTKGWRRSVARLATYSTATMCSVALAFAAPLLAITGRQSFTICLTGPTRSGKTRAATLMSGSVIGIGTVEDLLTWNITDAALEERLADFNDMVFPIDDLGQIKDNADKYLRIRKLAYTIAGGAATKRFSSFAASHGGAQQGWRSIALTSNEKPIHELAHSAKQERQGGEAARLIDLPVLFDGLDHIFDRLPKKMDAAAFRNWKRETFKEIAAACQTNHGTVFRKYIKSLFAHRNELKSDVEKAIAYFVDQACDQYDNDVARDVAEKFGLIYAGGLFGIRYDVLPWDEQDLLSAVTKAYRATRNLLPDDGVLLREGMKALKALRQRLTFIKKKDCLTFDYSALAGFKERAGDRNRYLIKRQAFNAIFSSTDQQDLVIKWLIDKGHITLAMPKHSSGSSDPKPQDQFVWPDGVRRRSIEVLWPRKKKEKKKGEAKKHETN